MSNSDIEITKFHCLSPTVLETNGRMVKLKYVSVEFKSLLDVMYGLVLPM